MKIFFQFCGPIAMRKPWENEAMLESFRLSLREASHPRFRVADNESTADVVALVESVALKDRHYPRALENEPVIRRRPQSCFAINYDDDAAGFLCGLYAGLSASRYNHRLHRSTGYLLNRTERVFEHAARRNHTEAKLLFSFRGANSHPIRARIFATDASWRKDARIHRVDRWFDHTPQEEANYFDEILESHFVLCPRGIAATSHRLFEVMQLGRVPVILSDQWVAPAGPAWARFAIRLSESRLADIPELLRARLVEATEMGRLARLEWERWFSPQTRMVAAAEQIEDLALSRPEDANALTALRAWRALPNRWSMGWTAPQRASRRLKKLFAR